MRAKIIRVAARLVCAALLAGAAFVRAAAEPAPLLLEDALTRAAAHHPVLAMGNALLRAQSARVDEAGLATQASLDFMLEDAAGTGDRRGLSSAQATLSLGHLIELGDKRRGRVAVAEAERAKVRTEQDARRLDVGAEVARRFIATLAAQAHAEVAADALRSAQRTLDAVDQRARAAQALPAEVARAGVGLEEARLEVEHAGHDLRGARQLLAAAMGEREVTFGRSAGQLLEFSPTLAYDVLERRIESTPDFTRFTDEARLRDAQVRLAELRRRPDIRTQIGVRHYGEGNDVALVAGFSVPLGSRSRATAAIDVARAERAQVDDAREASFLTTRAQLFDHYQELEHSRLESQVLRDTIVPALEDALRKSEYAWQRGRYSYLQWSEVQRELLGARRRLIESAARFHTLRVEIERLSGERIALSGESR